MPDINDIEIRSEEIQELIGYTPSWMTRWGLSLIVVLIALFVFLTWIIKYPDVVKGDVTLTTINPPIKIVNQADGKLISLTKSDGALLEINESFGEIENPISEQGIQYLNGIISQANALIQNPRIELSFNDQDYVFGDIQILYNDSKRACEEYQELITNNYQKEQINNLKHKIVEYEQLIGTTNKLLMIAKKELRNAEEKYRADTKLYNEGVIAKMEFFKEESNFHQKQQSLENLNANLTQHRITKIELSKQLLDLEYNKETKERDLQNLILSKVNEIENAIRNWQKTYQFVSPIKGSLSILKPISLNQYLKSGDVVFAVIPDNETYVVYMNIPSQGFGKIRTNQNVRIKIDNYPYQEYGQLSGTVEKLSQLPYENVYRAQIKLLNGLKTSYNKQLEFKPEMSGKAEIITEDLRLIERVFYRFKKIFE